MAGDAARLFRRHERGHDLAVGQRAARRQKARVAPRQIHQVRFRPDQHHAGGVDEERARPIHRFHIAERRELEMVGHRARDRIVSRVPETVRPPKCVAREVGGLKVEGRLHLKRSFAHGHVTFRVAQNPAAVVAPRIHAAADDRSGGIITRGGFLVGLFEGIVLLQGEEPLGVLIDLAEQAVLRKSGALALAGADISLDDDLRQLKDLPAEPDDQSRCTGGAGSDVDIKDERQGSIPDLLYAEGAPTLSDAAQSEASSFTRKNPKRRTRQHDERITDRQPAGAVLDDSGEVAAGSLHPDRLGRGEACPDEQQQSQEQWASRSHCFESYQRCLSLSLRAGRGIFPVCG